MKPTRSSRVVVASPSLATLVLDGPGELEDLEGSLLEDLEGPLDELLGSFDELLSVGSTLSDIAAASDSDAVRVLPSLSLDELDKPCPLDEPLSLDELDELDEPEEPRRPLELLMAQERRPTDQPAGHGELDELDEPEEPRPPEEPLSLDELDELDEPEEPRPPDEPLSLDEESCALSSPSDEL
jgi:hypothetical protein